MMLTTKGRYAVMALVDIAYYGAEGKVIALHEISSRQEIALNYLEQIFNKLKKANIVTSIKGPGGGYVLSDQTKNISILSIIQAVDESLQITRCSALDSGCLIASKKICFTHALWDGLGKNIKNYLSSISLEDVCSNIQNEQNILRS